MLPCNEVPILLTYATLDFHSVTRNALNSDKSNSQNLLIRAVRSPNKDLVTWGEELFARGHNGKNFFRKIRSIVLFLIKSLITFKGNIRKMNRISKIYFFFCFQVSYSKTFSASLILIILQPEFGLLMRRSLSVPITS